MPVHLILFHILMITSFAQEETIFIRLKNHSDFSLRNIEIISPASGLIHFGNIDGNKTSDYKKVKSAYRTAAVYAEIEGKKVEFLPDDFLGEQHLLPGKYTFSITVTEANGKKYLRVKFIDDESPK